MRILTVALTMAILTTFIFLTGCCSQYDNACLKTWYGLEPDPKNPDVYKTGLELWVDESFGPESGWQKTWIRIFGTKKEKEALLGS